MRERVFLSKEELTPIHELPDPFQRQDKSRVSTPKEWEEHREYLKDMLCHYMYGQMPPGPEHTSGELLYSRSMYGGKAVAEEILISFSPKERPQREVELHVHMIRPSRPGRVPVITWNQPRGRFGCSIEEELVCKRGYAIAEYCREELADDSADAMWGPLAQAYPDYDWGAIAMWSWGHSRILDYLSATDYADMEKIVATGHSRGGKAALCAAAYDERIALCAASGSGMCGAGSLRYLGGRLGEGTGCCETAGSIVDFFPYWWNDEFGKYGLRQTSVTRATMRKIAPPELMAGMDLGKFGKTKDEKLLPFDMHTLRALIAPRALITTDGLADTWANPYGTQICWMASDEVYRFLGAKGRNALHMREGGHGYMESDWRVVADFCDRIFFGTDPKTELLATAAVPGHDEGEQGNAKRDPMAEFTARTDFRSSRIHYKWSGINEK